MRRFKTIGLVTVGLMGLLLLGAAVPVAAVEIGCGRVETAPPAAAALVADDGYRRAEGDSFMTFPEWDIVYAYADLADVTRHSSEASFGYGRAIGGFRSNLCSVTATARAIGPVTADQRVTDYIVGRRDVRARPRRRQKPGSHAALRSVFENPRGLGRNRHNRGRDRRQHADPPHDHCA